MTIEAPAKVNLTLEVFGKRPDGYHALRSFVVPISLADTLDVETTDDGVVASDTGYPDDLCVKAVRVLADVGGRRSPGVRIRVVKRIPVGGGLGGGSADAAATLRALNELWQLGLPPEELADVGASVGSDVPALVLAQHLRGPVLMAGRGERVTCLSSRLPRSFSVSLVLANPGVPSSTREVYAACTPRPADGLSATAEMIAAWQSGRPDKIAAALQNDLQEPAVRQCPAIAAALSALKKAGAAGVMMSGSGSSVFGLVSDDEAAARLAADLTAGGLVAWPVRTLAP